MDILHREAKKNCFNLALDNPESLIIQHQNITAIKCSISPDEEEASAKKENLCKGISILHC